jgi:hypothetical protein
MPRLIAHHGAIIDAAGNRDLMHIKKSEQLSLLTGPATEKAGKRQLIQLRPTLICISFI